MNPEYAIWEAGYWRSPLQVITGLTWFVLGIGFVLFLQETSQFFTEFCR